MKNNIIGVDIDFNSIKCVVLNESGNYFYIKKNKNYLISEKKESLNFFEWVRESLSDFIKINNIKKPEFYFTFFPDGENVIVTHFKVADLSGLSKKALDKSIEIEIEGKEDLIDDLSSYYYKYLIFELDEKKDKDKKEPLFHDIFVSFFSKELIHGLKKHVSKFGWSIKGIETHISSIGRLPIDEDALILDFSNNKCLLLAYKNNIPVMIEEVDISEEKIAQYLSENYNYLLNNFNNSKERFIEASKLLKDSAVLRFEDIEDNEEKIEISRLIKESVRNEISEIIPQIRILEMNNNFLVKRVHALGDINIGNFLEFIADEVNYLVEPIFLYSDYLKVTEDNYLKSVTSIEFNMGNFENESLFENNSPETLREIEKNNNKKYSPACGAALYRKTLYMDKVNFYNIKIPSSYNFGNLALIVLSFTIVINVGSIVMNSLYDKKIEHINNTLNSIQQENTKYTNQINILSSQINSQLSLDSNKISLIEEFFIDKTHSSDIFFILQNTAPKGIVLEQLIIEDDDMVVISGYSKDYIQIGNFLIKLKEYGDFVLDSVVPYTGGQKIFKDTKEEIKYFRIELKRYGADR